MKKIRVAGVPEHFNLPWHICMENGLFEKNGVQVTWHETPEGTGAMCQALRNDEVDVAIILTEGITKDIISGNPSRIIQNYIGSPLIWGIHVACNSKYHDIQDLKGTKAAISRFGSGSHLMAYVNAQYHDWNTDDLKFEVINNLDGAVQALKNDEAQYFMWEHFTTKPLVDNKAFRLIADCPTPWPCFVIAASEKAIKEKPEALQKMLQVINTETADFKLKPKVDELLAERYEQKLEDIRKWLDLTRWSQEQISDEEIENVVNQLFNLGLVDQKVSRDKLLHFF